MSAAASAPRVGALVLVAGLLSGCGAVSLQGVALPGGANLGEQPYRLTVQFRDVLDLVAQASVKVDNVTVGQVQEITLDRQRWTADVTVAVAGNVALPANATAEIRQTTLLGEKFVALAAPTDTPPQGRLADNGVIPLERTSRNPEVEEVFGALSMLLNGGGVGQLQSISRELNKALAGNEDEIRALLDDLNLFVGTLDSQRTNITRALDGLDRLSANLAAQNDNLRVVLRDLEPGLAVLNDQRDELVTLLGALDKLSTVAVEVIDRSGDDLVADLTALRPALAELADAGDDLPRSLDVLPTVPFTGAVRDAIKGDYANLDVELDLDVRTLIQNLFPSAPGGPPGVDPLNPLRPAARSPGRGAEPPVPQAGPGKPTAPPSQVPRKPALPRPPGPLPLPGLGGGS